MAVQPHEKGSVLITTHLNFEEWVHVFGHTQMTQTLIVRFTYPCLVLETANKSGRLKNWKKNKTGRTQLNNRVCWTHGGRGHFSTPPRGIFQLNFTFRMTREGIDFEAMLTPWLRLCIGVAVLFVAATPLVYAIAALVRAPCRSACFVRHCKNCCGDAWIQMMKLFVKHPSIRVAYYAGLGVLYGFALPALIHAVQGLFSHG